MGHHHQHWHHDEQRPGEESQETLYSSKGVVSQVNSPIILTIGPSCMGPLVSQNSTWFVLVLTSSGGDW